MLHSLPVFASQLAIPVLLFRSRFPGLSPSSQPGFPCLLSGSVYSAFCQFPFILPCFAPTAVPQVLAWLCSPFGSLRFSISPFFSAFFRPLLSRVRLLSFRFFFSLLPLPASRWLSGCLLIRVPFRLFPYFRFRFGTQLSCIFFLRFSVSQHRCYFSCQPPVSSSAAPLSFRLRFGILNKGLHPQN